MSNSSPIFIVGYMHSGTTLLRDILSSHSSIYFGRGESKLYEFLPLISSKYPELESHQTMRSFVCFVADIIQTGFSLDKLNAPPQPNADGLSEDAIETIVSNAGHVRTHERIIPLVFDYLTRKAGKTRWLEKTPTHIFCIDDILQAIPNARFVEIVRDPRAVLASKKVRRETVWTERYTPEQQKFKHLEKAYDPLWDALSWKSAIHAGLWAKQNYGKSMLTIRYHDLVIQKEAVVRKICAFLNLDFEPTMLQVTTKNTAYWEEQREQGISSQYVNKWRDLLSPAEKGLIQWITREEMQELSYAPVTPAFSRKFLVPVLLARSGFEFF